MADIRSCRPSSLSFSVSILQFLPGSKYPASYAGESTDVIVITIQYVMPSLTMESVVYALRESVSKLAFNPLDPPFLGVVLELRDTLRLPAGSIPHLL